MSDWKNWRTWNWKNIILSIVVFIVVSYWLEHWDGFKSFIRDLF